MARMLVTIKIMPASIEIDLEDLKSKAKKTIEDFGGGIGKEELEPVAFGLKAIKLTYIIDEVKGVDEVCEAISLIDGVSSAEAIDMRRTLG